MRKRQRSVKRLYPSSDAPSLITHSCATLHNHYTIIALLIPLSLLGRVGKDAAGGEERDDKIKRTELMRFLSLRFINFAFDLSKDATRAFRGTRFKWKAEKLMTGDESNKSVHFNKL